MPSIGTGTSEKKLGDINRNGWRIEAYDISNTNGVDSVGAMVVFEGSAATRKEYRRFKIKTIEGANDFGSLQEVLYRRFKRNQQGDLSFSKMPDLLLIDGGKPQVNAALQVVKAMKVEIPVAGMVKDDKHRTRGLLYNEKELDLAEAELSRANMMLLYENGFSDFSSGGFCFIHKFLFGDVYEWAGQYRKINIQKREELLAGRSIWYSNVTEIGADLDKVFAEIKKIDWASLTREDFAKQIARLFPKLFKSDTICIRASS